MPDPRIAALEVELSLLARHHLQTREHSPDRALDRSGYQLLGRLVLEPMTLKQLAEAFRLDPSTVNRQIGALTRAGLVERVPDPAGSPARLVRPTKEGRVLLRRDRAVLQRQVRRVLAGWDADEIAQLRELLEKFNRSIEALEGRPWPRG